MLCSFSSSSPCLQFEVVSRSRSLQKDVDVRVTSLEGTTQYERKSHSRQWNPGLLFYIIFQSLPAPTWILHITFKNWYQHKSFQSLASFFYRIIHKPVRTSWRSSGEDFLLRYSVKKIFKCVFEFKGIFENKIWIIIIMSRTEFLKLKWEALHNRRIIIPDRKSLDKRPMTSMLYLRDGL